MTPWQLHVLNWQHCTRCPLHEQRTQVVLARGSLPCDVCFIGEAPGVSEDSLGTPFEGPAGKLLDKIIESALVGSGYKSDARGSDQDAVRVAFTNLVGCFPLEQKRAGINEPPQDAIEACAPRLREFVALAKPKLIVCVGGLAEKWVPKILGKGPTDAKQGFLLLDGEGPRLVLASIKHPAAILRENMAVQSLSVQKCVVAIADAVEELQ